MNTMKSNSPLGYLLDCHAVPHRHVLTHNHVSHRLVGASSTRNPSKTSTVKFSIDVDKVDPMTVSTKLDALVAAATKLYPTKPLAAFIDIAQRIEEPLTTFLGTTNMDQVVITFKAMLLMLVETQLVLVIPTMFVSTLSTTMLETIAEKIAKLPMDVDEKLYNLMFDKGLASRVTLIRCMVASKGKSGKADQNAKDKGEQEGGIPKAKHIVFYDQRMTISGNNPPYKIIMLGYKNSNVH